MVDSIDVGGTTLAYTVVRSARRKRTTQISVTPGRGIVVSVPMTMSDADARALVKARAAWIMGRLGEMPRAAAAPTPLQERTTLPYRGQQLPVTFVESAGGRLKVWCNFREFEVEVPARMPAEKREAAIRRRLMRWYLTAAWVDAGRAVYQFVDAVGAKPRAVLVREQQRRWGSCSADGTLRFNWRLVMAPPEILDYVAAHELTHLVHRNHGKDFWAAVERVCPSFATQRDELKRLGPTFTF